jgi:8-oxo-dGTP diphosphatase
MAEADRPAIAAAVIVHSGQVLLIRRRVAEPDLLWSFPGGKIESGETAEVTAVRETLEEAGLTVIARHVLGQRVHPSTAVHLTYVACDLLKGKARVAAPGEVAEVAWCDGVRLAERVPGDVFQPVQDYLTAMLTA